MHAGAELQLETVAFDLNASCSDSSASVYYQAVDEDVHYEDGYTITINYNCTNSTGSVVSCIDPACIV